MTSPLELIPVDMLDLQANQLEASNEKETFFRGQIIRILKEAEALGNVREVCRQHNVTEQTFYRWRNKYGGMEISDAKRLKGLEKENSEWKNW